MIKTITDSYPHLSYISDVSLIDNYLIIDPLLILCHSDWFHFLPAARVGKIKGLLFYQVTLSPIGLH